MKSILITIILVLFSFLFAEKYAVIYSPVKENLSMMRNTSKLDPKDMETVWQATYLKWEELAKNGYKFENIFVLYGDGIDYYRLDNYVSVRYSPEYLGLPKNYKMTKGKATTDEFNKSIIELENKTKKEDEMKVLIYDEGKFVEPDHFSKKESV